MQLFSPYFCQKIIRSLDPGFAPNTATQIKVECPGVLFSSSSRLAAQTPAECGFLYVAWATDKDIEKVTSSLDIQHNIAFYMTFWYWLYIPTKAKGKKGKKVGSLFWLTQDGLKGAQSTKSIIPMCLFHSFKVWTTVKPFHREPTSIKSEDH